MCRIITTPIEDYICNANKREEQKQKKKPSTSFEDELKKAVKEQTDGRTEE